MKNLDFIKKNAKKYHLKAEYLNANSLKIHSDKYAFDSWIVTEEDNRISLWHESKSRFSNKCSYHFQCEVKSSNSIWILQRINSHNEYKAYHKDYKKINLVDRVLSKDIKNKKKKLLKQKN